MKKGDTDQAERLKDRARLYNDENKMLNGDSVPLNKPNPQSLSRGKDFVDITPKRPDQIARAEQTAQAQQASQALQNTQRKGDLPPPQAYTSSEEKPTATVKPAIREKFEALRPGLVNAQNKNDPKSITEGILSARFESDKVQKETALEARPNTNSVVSARIDRGQEETATVNVLQTDDQTIRENPEIAINPRVSASESLEKSDTTALDRVDLGINADIRRADITGQQQREAQRELLRNSIDVGSQQPRLEDTSVESVQDNFDRYEIRQTERQTGVSEDPNQTRLDRVNPEDAAVASDQNAARTSEKILQRSETGLGGIKKANVAADFDFPPEVTPTVLQKQETQARVSGGDAINAPDRQVQKPIDKIERESRDETVSKTIDTRAESLQIQKLKTTEIKPDIQIDSTVQPRDKVLENQILAQRKDEIGIKAQGRVADHTRAENNIINDARIVANKHQREQNNLQEQGEYSKKITTEKRFQRYEVHNETVQNRDVRTESRNIGKVQRETGRANLSQAATETLNARYEGKVDQREVATDNVKFRKNDNVVLDTVAKNTRLQTGSDITAKRAGRDKFSDVVAYNEGVQLEDEAKQESYVINIAAPIVREIKREAVSEKETTLATDRIEITARTSNEPITTIGAEVQGETNANVQVLVANQVLENQNTANKDIGATTVLGDSAVRTGLDQIAGVA